jgi:hypothetical protein
MLTIADVLAEHSDSTGDRVLALDDYDIDYAMVRDCSMTLLSGGMVERYSCKDPWKHEEMQRSARENNWACRVYMPLYETWIIGQVHEIKYVDSYRMLDDKVNFMYHTATIRSNILHAQALQDCYVVSLKCPDLADRKSKEFFKQQVNSLDEIMLRDCVGTEVLTTVYLYTSDRPCMSCHLD